MPAMPAMPELGPNGKPLNRFGEEMSNQELMDTVFKDEVTMTIGDLNLMTDN